MQRRRILTLLSGTALSGMAMALGAAPALAGADQERARAALAAGEIRPLSEILAEIERRYIGRVIEVELDREDGRWVYDFKLLPPSGRVYELEVDAATAALLKSKGPVQERR